MQIVKQQSRGFDRWGPIEGASSPMGATWVAEEQAYNFALYSRHAESVTLLCYRREDPVNPVLEFRFDPYANKTGPVWHCRLPVPMLNQASLYAYRVDGPRDPLAGHRFDGQKVLLDPYAQQVFFPPGYSRLACAQDGPTDGKAPLGVLPPQRPDARHALDAQPRHSHDAVIYELHVKGFTARANSGVSPRKRGTFAGLIDKIPYLKELGVTIVELMPVHQFDPQEGNYWGYMTLNFFAPHAAYAVGDPQKEFRALVRAFHAAGIEVWLDVVYNHTSEGDALGPTYCFRGIDNQHYYLLGPGGQYVNDTGCGNVTRCAHVATRGLIVTSLYHWADTMRVDGFRFDLASILTRNHDGSVNLVDPPLIAEIGRLGDACDVALVAEAWDIASYQLGRSFPGFTWLQWNGKFRDDVRSFVKGDPGMAGALVQRLYGSDDLFPGTVRDAYRPYQSINFITAHDGFCLYDLVSYNQKNNWANGHANRDGSDDNRSWNCGWEGDVSVPEKVIALRKRQVRNLCALLLLANGIPMLLAGDEFMNTQRGNNNPYNQDNQTSWLDWDRLTGNRDIFRFFKAMIAFRKSHPSIGRSRYWRDDVSWHGPDGPADFSPASHAVAYCLRGASVHDDDLYVMINAHWDDRAFSVQEGNPGDWLRVVDTSLPDPNDIVEPGREPRLDSLQYTVKGRSVVVLLRRLQQP